MTTDTYLDRPVVRLQEHPETRVRYAAQDVYLLSVDYKRWNPANRERLREALRVLREVR